LQPYRENNLSKKQRIGGNLHLDPLKLGGVASSPKIGGAAMSLRNSTLEAQGRD
jgi:hypothetical protein